MVGQEGQIPELPTSATAGIHLEWVPEAGAKMSSECHRKKAQGKESLGY